jgi:hypothetical protein
MVKDLSGRGRSGNLMTTEEKGGTRLLLLAVQGVESTTTAKEDARFRAPLRTRCAAVGKVGALAISP